MRHRSEEGDEETLDRNNQEELEKAETLFNNKKPGEALLILDALCKLGPEDKALANQKLVIQIILDGRSKQFAKILHTDGKRDSKAISSSYRKLAQQIHPDKCKSFGAEEAFQLLNEAAGALQGSGEGGFVKGQTENHSWWEKWEGDTSSTKRKRKWEGEPQAETEEEILNLRQCPVEELKQIVGERQRAVLKPKAGSEEAKMTPSQRQQRVRTARGILNERIKNLQGAPKQGGFI